MASDGDILLARRTGPWEPVRGWTAAQRQAVFADDRVVCVLAGAGAGKTGVLTTRVARRCDDGSAEPRRVLVCTFSRKAADELRERVRRLGVVGPTVGTIHRVALRIVSDWRADKGVPPPIVLGDRRRVIEAVVSKQEDDDRLARDLETELGWAKAHGAGPEEYIGLVGSAGRRVRLPLDFVADAYSAYESERRRRGLIDLDDLVIEASRALGDSRFANAVRWRFRHLFVDELQDVNTAQFRLLLALGGPDPDLFVVGDPDQSIYGWNGADPQLLARFADTYPDARIIELEENHRSTSAIVRLASAALDRPEARASTRLDGPVPVLVSHETDEHEARWVALEVWRSHGPGRRWSTIAVLARTNGQLRMIAEALQHQRVPFHLAGRDFGPGSDLGTPDKDGTLREQTQMVADEAERDGVVLSTFHRAKGLQWPTVFVIGLREGLVPVALATSADSLAEERRLLYVALTRAEEELSCSWARRSAAGATQRAPSRWLAALERARTTLEDERAPADATATASHVAHLRSLVSRAGSGQPSV